MKTKGLPLPYVEANKQQASYIMAPLTYSKSGEFTTNISGLPIGALRNGARISDLWLSCQESGKDDTNTLSFTADVLINGTSALDTQPVIAHVSGEASQAKTSRITGDTGITQAVMDEDNNLGSVGDTITIDLTLTRTASPTTEIKHPTVVVEFEPVK